MGLKQMVRKLNLPHRYRIYDVLHKTAVTGIICFTLFLGYVCVQSGRHIVTVVKPGNVALKKRLREEELEREQAQKEEEIIRKQKALEKILEK